MSDIKWSKKFKQGVTFSVLFEAAELLSDVCYSDPKEVMLSDDEQCQLKEAWRIINRVNQRLSAAGQKP